MIEVFLARARVGFARYRRRFTRRCPRAWICLIRRDPGSPMPPPRAGRAKRERHQEVARATCYRRRSPACARDTDNLRAAPRASRRGSASPLLIAAVSRRRYCSLFVLRGPFQRGRGVLVGRTRAVGAARRRRAGARYAGSACRTDLGEDACATPRALSPAPRARARGPRGRRASGRRSAA